MTKMTIASDWSRVQMSTPRALGSVVRLVSACLLLGLMAPSVTTGQSTYMRRNSDGSIEFSNAPTSPSFEEHAAPGRGESSPTIRNERVTPDAAQAPTVARNLREEREQAEVQTAVNTLKSRDEVVYLNGISRLQGMGSAVVPPLLELLRVGDGRVRAGAASALSPEHRRRDPALTEQTVAALSQALDDAMPRVRHQAAQSLMGFGPQARAAVPPLTKLLGDENEDVRIMAARALAAIGPDAAAAVPELLKALHDPGPGQDSIRHALERIGTEQARQGLADFDRTADPRRH